MNIRFALSSITSLVIALAFSTSVITSFASDCSSDSDVSMPAFKPSAEMKLTEIAPRLQKVQKGKWTEKKQKIRYLKANGKMANGFTEIDGKCYYFDKYRVQRTGWQKIKGDYYFFNIKNGKNGYMVKNKKVDGILLKKNGKAKLTRDSRSKLNVLIKANKIVEKITKPLMKKSQKLEACFKYTITKFEYRGSPKFYKTKNWDRDYALDMFDDGHGSCYAYGAAFAYLANAVGYEKVCAVSSGGHGWAEINGKIYDPSWEITDTKHNYYAMASNLSGVDGRPNYQKYRTYVINV